MSVFSRVNTKIIANSSCSIFVQLKKIQLNYLSLDAVFVIKVYQLSFLVHMW